jgi:hypothetical protein
MNFSLFDIVDSFIKICLSQLSLTWLIHRTSQGGGLVDSNHVLLAHPQAKDFLVKNLGPRENLWVNFVFPSLSRVA